jgi:hypothetical protein
MIHHHDQHLAMGSPDRVSQGGLLCWLLAGAIVLLPVQIETPNDIRFAPSDLFLALTVMLGLGVWRGVPAAWSIWHVGLLSMFFTWVLAKCFHTGSIAQYELVNKLGGMTLLFSFYVCLTTLAESWPDLRWFLKLFVVSVTLQNAASCAAFLWVQYTGSDNVWLMFVLSGSVDRLAGMLVDPNAYGGLLTIAFAIALLCSAGKAPLLPGWFRALSLLTLAIGLFLTSSRSAWIGVAFLTLFGVIQNPRLLLVIPIMLGTGLVAVTYSMSSSGFETMLTISSRQNTIDDRVEINQNAWQMFRDNPIFGGGIGNFYERHNIIVHNSAMWFLAEFGIVGFMVFAGFIGWFCFKGISAYRVAGARQRPIVAGLMAAHLAMMGFSLGVEALYQRYWWLVMGLLASAYTLAIRDAVPVEETTAPLETYETAPPVAMDLEGHS